MDIGLEGQLRMSFHDGRQEPRYVGADCLIAFGLTALGVAVWRALTLGASLLCEARAILVRWMHLARYRLPKAEDPRPGG